MDENFERNENEQVEREQIPAAAPQPQEPEVVEQVAPAAPRKRRRKRRKRPYWQRMLWKYWPPIRFGLLILAGVLLIWLLISSIGALFGNGETKPMETDPPVITDPTTDPTTEPTTEPTEPPTSAPTEPPDPFAGAVSDEWFADTLLIGDFGFAGQRDNARAANADYFCSSGLGVYNWDEEKVSDKNFDKQDLITLLSSKTYKKVIINLGINNCGYPTSSLVNAYYGLVTTVQNHQPNAKIILHGIMLVGQDYAKGRDYFSPIHIAEVNERISKIANGEQIFYISVNESFADTNGYLISSASKDGCHLTSNGYKDWAKLMRVELGKLGIE